MNLKTWFILCALISIPAFPSAWSAPFDSAPPILQLNGVDYRLDQPQDLSPLQTELQSASSLLKNSDAPIPDSYTGYLSSDAIKSKAISRSKLSKVLIEMSDLAKAASAPSQPEAAQARRAILELDDSLRQNLRDPSPPLSLWQVGKLLFRFAFPGFIRGQEPSEDASAQDDPPSSAVWTRPASIPTQNLAVGFGRDRAPDISNVICDYSGPKTSYGTHIGYSIACGDDEYSIKFDEFRTHPFNARIFWALGYHAEPGDYSPRALIHWDRRIFTQIHSRKRVEVRVVLPGPIPDLVKTLTQKGSGFEFITQVHLKDKSVREVTLKDGEVVPVEALDGSKLVRWVLNRRPNGYLPWLQNLKDEDFDPAVEAQIDYFETSAVLIKKKDPNKNHVTVGPWDMNSLDHASLREVRGLALLSAWLDWYDVRYDNMSLILDATPGHKGLQAVVTDLGAGLGNSNRLVPKKDKLSQFRRSFTQSKGVGHFKLRKFKTLNDAVPFKQCTLDDAVWMAKLIGELTPSQIRDALVASHFEGDELEQMQERLLERRAHMLCDLHTAVPDAQLGTLPEECADAADAQD